MKLDTLTERIEGFAGFLGSHQAHLHFYKYDLLAHFNSSWTFADEDFAQVYDRALYSEVTRRWWNRTGYEPKEMMLHFIRQHPEYAKQAFRDLFDETKLLDRRIDRFQFYCDELLGMYKQLHRDEVVNNHYQDSSIISVYLSGRYPETYTLYPGRRLFNQFLIALHGKPNRDFDELDRFFKIMRVAYKFLRQDPSIQVHLERSGRQPGNLLLAHEFLYYVTGSWERTVL